MCPAKYHDAFIIRGKPLRHNIIRIYNTERDFVVSLYGIKLVPGFGTVKIYLFSVITIAQGHCVWIISVTADGKHTRCSPV